MDLASHLTNTSLQTPSLSNPDPNDNVRSFSELVGCHVLSEAGPTVISAEDIQNITDQVCEVLAGTFKAALESPIHFQVELLFSL